MNIQDIQYDHDGYKILLVGTSGFGFRQANATEYIGSLLQKFTDRTIMTYLESLLRWCHFNMTPPLCNISRPLSATLRLIDKSSECLSLTDYMTTWYYYPAYARFISGTGKLIPCPGGVWDLRLVSFSNIPLSDGKCLIVSLLNESWRFLAECD